VPLLPKKGAAQHRRPRIALQSGSRRAYGWNYCEIDECGGKSPACRNLFAIPGVIHGDNTGLVAAQTQGDYFCGAA
jgi:hypothetical protein